MREGERKERYRETNESGAMGVFDKFSRTPVTHLRERERERERPPAVMLL